MREDEDVVVGKDMCVLLGRAQELPSELWLVMGNCC